ncbi:MAG: AAA family ATPase [Parabacteroides gordonii]|nr:AAA family ATPase [Parabacteroides gordonii]
MKNEQTKNTVPPATVSVAAGNYANNASRMPSSEEMEQAVVLAILAQSAAICEVGDRLRPEMFTNPDYCLVYRAMLALYQHEADIDMLSVEREMRRLDPDYTAKLNGLAFIADGLLKVRNAAFIKTYAAWVIRCWVLRQAIMRMTARVAEAHEPGVDVTALLNASHKDLEKLEEEFAVHSTTRTVAEVGERVLAEIYHEQERRRAGEQLQISTGLDEFDHYLGGLYKGELLVLAGRPSMGKTALALHMALSAARQGKKVCLFSLEMTERQLISRLLCTLSGVEPDKLRFKLLDDDDRRRLDKAADELYRLPLFLNYCSGSGLTEIRARCMILNRKHKLDLVIIDYLNLINVSSDRAEVKDTMDLALGEAAGKLKTLAMELDVSCLMLAQLNRNCETRTDHIPVMSDLRNSGEIEQIADSIAMVYRPEQYNELYDNVTHESYHRVGRLFIIKNRNGGTGEVRFRYNDSLTQIYPYKK